ncbi:hypothetical protein BV97_03951 [Novosphingobium resinovorum]|uniref:Uncharacterized protein n=1 Tax=Novosphingobium resinovorum TaxID=158500 RepID=A0A031JRI2_9SPHN|nr:hypothetical protein [Novosphingobium resinovorum]EZP79514.1 hypothetical protein BV97_03951 [Novosphingobium resinovorum]
MNRAPPRCGLPSYVLVAPTSSAFAVIFYCADCDVTRTLSTWDSQADAIDRAKVEGERRAVPIYHAISAGDLSL